MFGLIDYCRPTSAGVMTASFSMGNLNSSNYYGLDFDYIMMFYGGLGTAGSNQLVSFAWDWENEGNYGNMVLARDNVYSVPVYQRSSAPTTRGLNYSPTWNGSNLTVTFRVSTSYVQFVTGTWGNYYVAIGGVIKTSI